MSKIHLTLCVNIPKQSTRVQKSLRKARIILLNYFKGNQHRGGNDKENCSLDDLSCRNTYFQFLKWSARFCKRIDKK